MSRDFRLFPSKANDFFTSPKYSLDYSLVMIHALANLYLKSEDSRKDADHYLPMTIDGLKKFSNPDTREVVSFRCPKFIDVHEFKVASGDCGLVVVDRSGGCYPLIVYPEDQNPEHGLRLDAFLKSIDDLADQKNAIRDVIRNTLENRKRALDTMLWRKIKTAALGLLPYNNNLRRSG